MKMRASSFNHLVGAGEQSLRETARPSAFAVFRLITN